MRKREHRRLADRAGRIMNLSNMSSSTMYITHTHLGLVAFYQVCIASVTMFVLLGCLPVASDAFAVSIRQRNMFLKGDPLMPFSVWGRARPSKDAASLNMMAKLPNILPQKKGSESPVKERTIDIGDEIGSGSYGTVHLCNWVDGSKSNVMVAKRAWTKEELEERTASDAPSKSSSTSSAQQKEEKRNEFEERAKRCAHYLDVERHCFEKLQRMRKEKSENKPSGQLPDLLGVFPDSQGRQWLVFSYIERKLKSRTNKAPEAAVNLADAIKTDWKKQHTTQSAADHHLSIVQRELGLPEEASFGDTLDVVLQSLLSVITEVHEANIVHRDIKPANLLCDPTSSSLILIDFGSAADMDPISKSWSDSFLTSIGTGKRVGLDGTTVAISPVYAAPELFVKWDRAPLSFDTFSVALIFCQLLFNLLDDRVDASFYQQLQDVDYDLDAWLARELSSTIRLVGVEEAVSYLGERPGLWSLLKDMLRSNPERRVSSQGALKRLKSILSERREGEIQFEGGNSFFDSVLASDVCEIDIDEEYPTDRTIPPNITEGSLAVPRPLHFVATFERSSPLGLILSEADGAEEEDEDMDEEAKKEWRSATVDAMPGEVFVKGIKPMGQASKMGIFEIGDQLRGVGEFPLAGGGFESAVDMLSKQPESAQTVRLHFDRKSVASNVSEEKSSPHLARVIDQGAWSSKGRRKAQEDSFVLNEVHDERGNAVLIAGVFDGHGGTAASTAASNMLPNTFASEVASAEGKATPSEIRASVLSSWETICSSYRRSCDSEDGTCVAEYDQREGTIMAGVGSEDLVAGTTAVVAALRVDDDGGDELSVLNCGDSRALVVGRPRGVSVGQKSKQSVVHFSTRDHSPRCEREAERLQVGKDAGLDYSLPECSLSRWWLTIGDYQYAVSRSLEGSFASSKGIVSDADLTTVNLPELLAKRENGIVVLSSDGLFDVMDNEEVGREVILMRETGFSASDAAKNLCGLALKKGTSDNVSVVVVYLD